jgi:kumamolisin
VVCNADPDTGYEILVDGQQMVVGGTSAAAPLWAGLITLLNQKLQTSIGFINPSLYEADQSICFRQVSTGTNAATSASNAARTGANTATSGNNAATSGSNSATTGWNPVAGLGSPRGIELIHAQHGLASQTTVNTKQTSRTDPASHTERSHH